jgi:tetratricopeptide (TPR) repeat protein
MTEYKPTVAKMIHTDPRRDLCLLELAALPPDAEAIPLAAQSAPPATAVHCIGNPGKSGAYWVYNSGTVRQVVRRRINYGDFIVSCRVMECQNPTNPGDSGGPVVNGKFELIGVTTGGTNGVDLMNTSIDVTEVRDFLAEVDSFVDPRLVGDFKRRAQAYLAGGRHKKALEDFARVLELNADDGEAHLGTAVCWSRLGEHDKSLAEFAAAEKLLPQHGPLFRERGNAWALRKQPAKAVVDWSEAIRINPQDIDALESRALSSGETKAYDQALADWTAIIGLLPGNPEPLFQRGKIHLDTDSGQKAVEDFTAALKLTPSVNCFYHRGLANMALGQLDPAFKDLTIAILNSQGFSKAFCARGDLLRKAGKLQEALDDLSEAVRLNPDFAAAYFLRSLTFRDKGLKELAQADYEKAIALNPALAHIKVPGRPETSQVTPEQAPPPESLTEAPDLETCMRELARDIVRVLSAEGQDAVAVGAFTSPPQLPASTGPGLANFLSGELRKFGVQVGAAQFGVQGEFRDVPDAKAGKLAVRIQADLVGRDGARLGRFARLVRGAGNVAPLLGLSVALPSDRPERERERQLQQSVDHPLTQITGSRVAAAPGSPYQVEILVREPAGLKPRAPKLDDGLAFVDIEKGESYAVRVVNNSDNDCAVTLAIDGLNLFAFSQNREYSYFILAARSETTITGWHRTNQASDAFVITEYAKSAAAELGAGGASLGTITASFAAAWPADKPAPADELSARMANRGEGKATGRGPVVALNYQEVRRQVGAVRAVVSIRYDKP